jgi:hypothetical protein
MMTVVGGKRPRGGGPLSVFFLMLIVAFHGVVLAPQVPLLVPVPVLAPNGNSVHHDCTSNNPSLLIVEGQSNVVGFLKYRGQFASMPHNAGNIILDNVSKAFEFLWNDDDDDDDDNGQVRTVLYYCVFVSNRIASHRIASHHIISWIHVV